MAEINNISPDTLISGSNRSDTISNAGINVTISALDGNDSINNESQSYFNDSIDEWFTITPHDASIDGGFGNDTIRNSGDNVSIFGGADFDYIDNSGKRRSFPAARTTTPFITTARTLLSVATRAMITWIVKATIILTAKSSMLIRSR